MITPARFLSILLLTTAPRGGSAALLLSPSRSTERLYPRSSPLLFLGADENDDGFDTFRRRESDDFHSTPPPLSEPKGRRRVFTDVLRFTSAACATAAGCACCAPRGAHALARIATPSAEALVAYDPPRNAIVDAAFARGMAGGMRDYEAEAYPRKAELFQKLFSAFENKGKDAVIVEVGMGSFPNAPYYQRDENVRELDIIGVDPNDRMEPYARDNAKRTNLMEGLGDSLRIVHGVSEALPFADNTCDAVVCTLTLCSVLDPEKSVAEIKRVLKPGGQFLFWEHVLSETDPSLAQQQIILTPMQVISADGCHLDRRTGETIKAAGFKQLDMEYLELKNFNFLNPTVCGIATA